MPDVTLKLAYLATGALSALLTTIPRTEIMTTGSRDALRMKRRQLFSKPAAGYGPVFTQSNVARESQ